MATPQSRKTAAKATPSKAKSALKIASKTKQGANGIPKPASVHQKALKPPKSPTGTQSTQPAELSDEDYSRLRDWLNNNDRPFSVHTVPLSRKRKRAGANQLQAQDDLFEARLSVRYEVKPRDKWESMRKYKKFTVGDESIATGECILVKHDDSEDTKIDTSSQWKAKVLEVRALDPEHVYVRLSWLNRPEDLDSGRKDYHGKNELIPTNQMDVIDAMAVNGVLHVKHWDELADDDEKSMPEEDEYFWRQTFDFANTKTFSALRKICIDDAPQNPDELIVQCSNGDCRQWLHVRCIAKRALQTALYEQAAPKRSSKAQRKKSKPKNPANNPNLTAVADASNGNVTAEVFIRGHPDRPKVEPAEEDEIIITTEDGEQYSEDVRCLDCQAEVA